MRGFPCAMREQHSNHDEPRSSGRTGKQKGKRQNNAVQDSVKRYARESSNGAKVVNLPSMADALTGPSSANVDQDDVWNVLNDSISRFDGVPRSTADNSAHMANNPEAQKILKLSPGESLLKDLDVLPTDFALKRGVKFTSSVSFQWCKTLSASAEAAALEDFNSQRENITDYDRVFASGMLFYRYPDSSFTFEHPDQPWQHSIRDCYNTNSTRASADHKAHLKKRLDDWEAALRSLYYRYRYGHVPHFYVLFERQAVLFARRANGSMSVLLTRSTASQRAALNGLGINYQAPLLKAEDELGDIDRTMLHFVENNEVHGLYDYLIFLAPRQSSATDVPCLLAERPFVGTQLSCLLSLRLRNLS
mmetsp:Transcript_1220/g.3762  ORF Transcript_1220/g.3762 Transcript_1220/m.3762 type:complete len:363 (-) Transcript_1220:2234-3322(-)